MQIRTTDLNITDSSMKAKVQVRIHIASDERLGSFLWWKCENVVKLWLLTFFSGPMNAAHALAQAQVQVCACWWLRSLGILGPPSPSTSSACSCHKLVDHILISQICIKRGISPLACIFCMIEMEMPTGGRFCSLVIYASVWQSVVSRLGQAVILYFFLHYICFYFVSWNVILSLLKPIIIKIRTLFLYLWFFNFIF